ncbi:MAG: PhoH family protein [Chloroflexota bacterium]
MEAEVRASRRITLGSNEEALNLLGRFDQHLRTIENSFHVTAIPRGNEIQLSGPEDEVGQAEQVISTLADLSRGGNQLSHQEVRYAIRLVKEGRGQDLAEVFSETLVVTVRGKAIKPKTIGQKEYADSIKSNGLTLGIGPAGTGKTYLAMAMAIQAFKSKEVSRIILTRPAVEAGEKLGFLPGDLQDKVDPYLRPLYDALFDILGVETFQKYMERGLIEVAPLAYMRGRTLDDSFIILDEAQNTTPEQMKMFLTRLGFGSKAVVTGDITQIDLPKGQSSGLAQAREVLAGVPGIAIVHLTEKDVVRHELVQRIILAYEKFSQAEAAAEPKQAD